MHNGLKVKQAELVSASFNQRPRNTFHLKAGDRRGMLLVSKACGSICSKHVGNILGLLVEWLNNRGAFFFPIFTSKHADFSTPLKLKVASTKSFLISTDLPR